MSFSACVQDVSASYHSIENQRRSVEGEGAVVRAELVDASRALEELTQQASKIAAVLAEWQTDSAGESSVRVVQRRVQNSSASAAALAEEVAAARRRTQNLLKRVASSGSTAQKAVPAAWNKASGGIASTAATLASTEQRVAELKLSVDRLSQASQTLAHRVHALQQQLQSFSNSTADKQKTLAELRASLSQAQSTSTALVDRLVALDPMDSLAREHAQCAATIRKLQSRIASVRSETSGMETQILAIDVS